MTHSVAALGLLAGVGSGPSTLQRTAPVRLDLPTRGHGGLASRLGSFCNFDADCPIALGSGCDLSQSSRAAAVGSTPVFVHHAISSQQRCTSRWCPGHGGTVNSSLTLRPSAGGCAKCGEHRQDDGRTPNTLLWQLP